MVFTKLPDIANIDQTPLPFVLDDGKTYADKGSSEVWSVSGSSDLEKQQCSVQLTIFADGVPRIRLLVIFRGKDLRITRKKQETWDRRVQVAFQPKAWCDESMMKKMDIGTMGKHLNKPSNNWLNWKNFSC